MLKMLNKILCVIFKHFIAHQSIFISKYSKTWELINETICIGFIMLLLSLKLTVKKKFNRKYFNLCEVTYI